MGRFSRVLLLVMTCMVIWIGIAFAEGNNQQKITIVTSNHPPLGYVENDKIKGFCAEIVQTILDELKIDAPINVVPWPRAYRMAEENKNTLIFTLARLPDREDLFHWVGVIISGRNYLYSLKERNLKLDSLEQAKDYRIGGTRGDIRVKYLEKKGFTNLDLVANGEINALKLLNDRVDLWLGEELFTNYILKEMGYDPQNIVEKAYELDPVLHGYLAFSKSSDPEVVAAFRRVLEEMKEDGRYGRIMGEYL